MTNNALLMRLISYMKSKGRVDAGSIHCSAWSIAFVWMLYVSSVQTHAGRVSRRLAPHAKLLSVSSGRHVIVNTSPCGVRHW